MTATRHLSAAGLVALLLVAAPLLAGCGLDGPTSVCVPELSVAPRVAQPGSTITVTTARACAVDAPAAGWTVRAFHEGDVETGAETTVVPDADGSFTLELTLPADMPTGRTVASIMDWWDVAECPDNASCASASGYFHVEAP